MDLPGHGKSQKLTEYSASQYAEAITSVANKLDAEKIILVGHSMSGAYVLEASLSIPKTSAIIIVDTLKNMDELFTFDQAEQYMFSHYRKDFKSTMENMISQYLFSKDTPPAIKTRLIDEFLSTDVDHAIDVLAPLYKMDVQPFAKKVTVPVRAINSDFIPTNVENNKKYFKDYECVEISGTGHYPMIEKPQEFNQILERVLSGLPA